MGAEPGVEAGVQENAALSLNTDQSDASFGSSLLKKGQEALDSSPTISPKRHSKRYKGQNGTSHPGTPYPHNKSRKSFTRCPRRKRSGSGSPCKPVREESNVSPPTSPKLARKTKSPPLSPSVRRASISAAMRKSFRNSRDEDDDVEGKTPPSPLKVDLDEVSSSDEETKEPPKQPSHLRTPASMKKGFFQRRCSLEDFLKQLQLFKVESRTFHDTRIKEARSSYKRAEMKTRRMSKKLSDVIDTFKASSPKHSDNDAKSRWKHYAQKINHKKAVERTKNRLKKMNSFWYVKKTLMHLHSLHTQTFSTGTKKHLNGPCLRTKNLMAVAVGQCMQRSNSFCFLLCN